jgi:hypothetical protein
LPNPDDPLLPRASQLPGQSPSRPALRADNAPSLHLRPTDFPRARRGTTRVRTPRSGQDGTVAGDVHLRSVTDLRGCHIQGTDGPIGHVDDLITDDASWEIRYLVVDAGSWWLDRKVLIAPRWTSDVSWEDRKLHINLSREAIKSSPEWVATDPVNRAYEERLYDYYGRPVYWGPDEPREAGQLEHHPGIHLP